MSYYNEYGGPRYDRGKRQYSERPYGRDGWASNSGRRARRSYDDRPRKRSGAKFGTGKNSKPYVQGWKATKAGMMKIIAGPTSKGMVSEQSEQWVAKVTVGYNPPQTVTAFYNVNTRKLTIPDLNFVLNPNAPNGGYCGPFYKTRGR